MEQYKNISGHSGIEAFEIHEKSIVIRFISGETYLYDYTVPGRDDVEQMKKLARTGKGLSTFISQSVRERYAAKLT